MKRLRTWVIITLSTLFISGGIWFALPVGTLFSRPHSTLFFSSDSTLLRATLASDGQFRFPPSEGTIPERYRRALITFEDHRFYCHQGVSLRAIAGAIRQNIRAGRRVRGGSTITMQVARMRKGRNRTYLSKIFELFEAIKIDLHYDKEAILKAYGANAPMGGNIVGIEAACHRYFGHDMAHLTWAEAALLAVLPNAPGLMHTSRNRAPLKTKRDRLLEKLYSRGTIDATTLSTAKAEAIPHKRPLPFAAPHATSWLLRMHRDSTRFYTTLDRALQGQLEQEVETYYQQLRPRGINNCAVLICRSGTGEVLAYSGSPDFYNDTIQGQVDGVQGIRSPGSLLKPFLMAAAIDRGPFLPQSQVNDIPTSYGTYRPANASKQFLGMVSLSDALRFSLNVPFVRLLNWYGVSDFFRLLQRGGISTLKGKPMDYGLPLILGAFESSLWELTGLYLSLSTGGVQCSPTLLQGKPATLTDTIFSPAATELTLNAMTALNRPGIEAYWEEFNQQIPIAWKTGTSYGRKDGWAIGTNRRYTIGVWTGNVTGITCPDISGSSAAGPLLFRLFNRFGREDTESWFPPIADSLYDSLLVCTRSGFQAGEHCDTRHYAAVPRNSYRREERCPYHRRYHIDSSGNAVCSRCWSGDRTSVNRYILPPAARNLLKKRGIPTDTIPVHKKGCTNGDEPHRMTILYPTKEILIFTPRNMEGSYEKSIFKALHQQESATLFWTLDDRYIGSTTGREHNIAVDLPAGNHRLRIEDEEGVSREVRFRSMRKEK